MAEKRNYISATHGKLSIARQCELLGISRSAWYIHPKAEESAENQHYMKLIDEE